jgi:serine/threonine protein kinase
MALNELNVLKEIDHPNICRVIEAYKDEDHFALVTELCKGKALFHEIVAVD